MSQQPGWFKRAKVELCYTDTGGTFTDTFIVDENGDFVVSKAPTTPEDISIGYFQSVEVAAQQLGMDLEDIYSQLSIIGYGATVVLNTILTRKGVKTGVIITKGFEQILLMERGKQTWTEYDLVDRIHARTHRHTIPIVPFELIRGVTERIDCLGKEVIPLYEQEVIEAGNYLIDQGVEAIVVCLLFCWQNPMHEKRAEELLKNLLQERGKEVPIYLSFEVSPVMRELSRLNAAIIEAYATPSSKKALGKIEERVKSLGYKGSLQIMQSSGGLASVSAVKMVETLQSGPIGGLIGGQYIGNIYGFDNIITTDVGGTSFDVGLVTGGVITIDREPVCARMILGVPIAQINSIGAGGGTMARIDPLTGRLLVGPESAGAMPGPVCYDQGGDMPTVTDANLVLGYYDPDYFLGGKIKLNVEKATRVMKEKIADPLGISVVEASTGIKDILDVKMKEAIRGMVISRGHELSEYYLLSFGGAGPAHVAGYTDGLPIKGIMMFPYSAVFSAFGAASADFEHRYSRAINIIVPPYSSDEIKRECAQRIDKVWSQLEETALGYLKKEGFKEEKIHFRHLAMMRYGRQLDDLIVTSPVSKIKDASGWDKLIAAFETMYENIYAKAAKYPQAGYEIVEVGLVAKVPKVKPKLRKYSLESEIPPPSALKGKRDCFFKGEAFPNVNIYEWDSLKPGNRIPGPAIVENPVSTLVVPPQRAMSIDEYLTCWLH